MRFTFRYETGGQFIWSGTLGHAVVGGFVDSLPALYERKFTEVRSLVQVHGNTVMDDTFYKSPNQEGDGLITELASTLLLIRTADCLPVYLIAEKKIGMIHVGWRSLKAGIIERALALMNKNNVSAVFGPSIFWQNYEIDEDCYNSWDDPDLSQFLYPAMGTKKYLDMRGFAQHILTRTGMNKKDIYHIPLCTFNDGLPSYRRNGSRAGRIINAVFLL